jgi:hypothetical protein
VLRSGAVPARAIRVTEIGWKARRLIASAPAASALVAALSRSRYLDVAGEIVWLGPPGSTLHARAMIADTVPLEDAVDPLPRLDVSSAREWRPATPPRGLGREAIARAAGDLARAAPGLGRPDGFGALLTDTPPAFPLDRATADARAFLAACAAGDAAAATVSAERLLGLGPGLTPAGDDLVGGACFARRVLTGTGLADDARWRAAALRIRTRAAERTHRISATLLGDLLDGEAYAPLHEVAVALARDDAASALDAAARLVRLGHSSGWDLLTGFLGALGAPAAR